MDRRTSPSEASGPYGWGPQDEVTAQGGPLYLQGQRLLATGTHRWQRDKDLTDHLQQDEQDAGLSWRKEHGSAAALTGPGTDQRAGRSLTQATKRVAVSDGSHREVTQPLDGEQMSHSKEGIWGDFTKGIVCTGVGELGENPGGWEVGRPQKPERGAVCGEAASPWRPCRDQAGAADAGPSLSSTPRSSSQAPCPLLGRQAQPGAAGQGLLGAALRPASRGLGKGAGGSRSRRNKDRGVGGSPTHTSQRTHYPMTQCVPPDSTCGGNGSAARGALLQGCHGLAAVSESCPHDGSKSLCSRDSDAHRPGAGSSLPRGSLPSGEPHAGGGGQDAKSRGGGKHQTFLPRPGPCGRRQQSRDAVTADCGDR